MAGLDSTYDVACTQLLTGSELPRKLFVFSRLYQVCKDARRDASVGESTTLVSFASRTDNTLGGRTCTRVGRDKGREGGKDNSRICHRCEEPGHIKKNCWKLRQKPSSFPVSKFAYVATQEGLLLTPPTPKSEVLDTIAVPVGEYACLTQFHAS